MPFAIGALQKALDRFTARELSVQALCRLVHQLDATFNVELAQAPDAASSVADDASWLGDLWHCCDWCDDNWTHDSAAHLHEEAARVARRLKGL